MNKTIYEDIGTFVKVFPFSDDLQDSVFLITGTTGLIGSLLVHCLLALHKNIHIIAPVRNKNKAQNILGDSPYVTVIECDLLKFDYSSLGNVDYIIHCAAPTQSKFYTENAVETINTIYRVSDLLLKYAMQTGIRSFVFLSSLEVYGSELNNDIVVEDKQGYWNPLDIRSSYPLAKRVVENLCCAYSHEYKVPVKIARLTQTTGAGISTEDNRVIVQFTRLAAEGKDILLHTSGDSARPYCYTIDAITAILYILLKGENGEAYNVANEDTYISAKDLAEYVRDHFNSQINILIKLDNYTSYAPPSKLRLSAKKLCALGWRPLYDLQSIFDRLMKYLKEEA